VGGPGEVEVQDAFPDFILESDKDLDALLSGTGAGALASARAIGTLKSAQLVVLRMLFDTAAFLGAARFTYYVRFENSYVLQHFPPARTPNFSTLLIPLLIGLPLLLLFLRISGMYQTHMRVRVLDRFPRIIAAVNAFVVSFLVVMFLVNQNDPSRGYIIILWFCAIVFLFFGRLLLQAAFAVASIDDVVQLKTLIVGSGKVGKSLALKLKQHPEFGLNPVGFVDNDPLYEKFTEPDIKDLKVLGGTDDFLQIVKDQDIGKVIIGFSKDSHEQLLDLVSKCNEAGVDCSILPRLFEIITDEIIIREVGGISLVPIKKKRIAGFDHVLKNAEDYTLVILGLLFVWPVLLATAIAIKLDTRGPVFFKQERVGKDGKHFNFVKFRSMVANAEDIRDGLENEKEEGDLLWKIVDDPRITRVGKWIRKFSIDELPQIFNVIAGQMSLVGPRPGLPDEVDRYKGWHRLRLNVKPGITGLWQVNGRSDIPFDEMVKYDLYYIERWSIWLDVKTMLRTFAAVLSRKGAY